MTAPKTNHHKTNLSWLKKRLIKHLSKHRNPNFERILTHLQNTPTSLPLTHDTTNMVHGALQIANSHVRDIMIPAAQMVVLESNQTLHDALPVMITSRHSRFPVLSEDRKKVIGMLLAKDLLPFFTSPDKGQPELEAHRLEDFLRPVMFVPESKRLDSLLKDFRKQHQHLAIVIDEYGAIAGLVTIEDVVEEIVGEIEDEHFIDDESALIRLIGPKCWHVEASTPITLFNKQLQTQIPDDDFDTIGGFVAQAFGRIPHDKEKITIDHLQFTIKEVSERQIKAIEVICLPRKQTSKA